MPKVKLIKETKKEETDPQTLTHRSQRKELEQLVSTRKILLMNRMRVPPAINQFSTFLDPDTFSEILSLFKKYRPETQKEKSDRLSNKDWKKQPKPILVKCGIKHVTQLIENKKAKFVLIACDVDPLEIVIHLPTLCKKMNIPYAIVKGKELLGSVVNQKNATSLLLCDVRPEDTKTLNKFIEKSNNMFSNRYEDIMKKWGSVGGVEEKEEVVVVE
ncbi:ribosomal protein L7a [Hamiltosporidium tvaerminnensis]|uniref:60S ribosomal protein L8 n=1 Tax=Hamiltosporidium tvaerminnensis TaxID=1176355 RepID=A0A4Q9LC01_9MICR|nr:60S ribosomal protein L8 [Hamiltosporidium tvaerminnensis]TBU04875.1 ribosomal protein L7a [Hamiltosporidium tvaerminnensis]